MDLFGEKRILTVSQLASLIKGVLEENFEHVWVQGEVSNLSLPASGHCYFTLRDSGAQIRCVMFRTSSRAVRFRLQDGMGLIARGRISLFETRGDCQFIVEYLEPQGIGALQLAFAQLKERLAREGLFDERHKKPIPRLPRRVGVVTSATGAAIHDILNVMRRRFAAVDILLRPVRVQGEGAAEEIAAAIRDFNASRDIDVMIVGRGGGSLEDLQPFNEEVVARAIYRSRIPVIAAVGHEVDYTIADFVADLRAPTPSAAAELVVASRSELEGELDSLRHRMEMSMIRQMERRKGELDSLSRALKDPSMRLQHLFQRLDDLGERLALAAGNGMTRRRERLVNMGRRLRQANPALEVMRATEKLEALTARGALALQHHLEKYRERVAASSGKLQALSPLETLARGYAVVEKMPDGGVVRDVRQLHPVDRLRIRLHRGGAMVRVEEVFPGDPEQA